MKNIKQNPRNPNSNMKAFSVQHVNKTKFKLQKQAQLAYTVQSNIKKDKSIQEHPLIAFIGPQNVGKTTLVNSVIYNLSHKRVKQNNNVITLHIPNSQQQNISFYDCPNSLESIIDISRIASHIVLVIDINKGIELDHFEELCALQSLNWPLITVVLTHCDEAHNFIKQRQAIKDRLEKEIQPGLKLYIANYEEKTHMYDNTNMQLLSRHLTTKAGSWNNFIKQNPAIMISNVIKQGDKYILQGFVHGSNLHKQDTFIVPGLNYQPIHLTNFQIEKNPLEQQDKLLSNKTEIYAPLCQIDDLVVNKQWIQVQQQKKQETQTQKIDLDSDDDMQLFAGGDTMKGEYLLENEQIQEEEQEQSNNQENIEYSSDSSSTQTNLDNVDLENMIQMHEEVEEVEENDEQDNKLLKLQQQKLQDKIQVLPQPQSIIQYQQSIYRYYKQKNIQKQQASKQNKQNNLLKLFDDEPTNNVLYLDVIDPKCQLDYENNQFIQYQPKNLSIQIQDKNNYFYFNCSQNLVQQDVKCLFINDQTDYVDQINEQLNQYLDKLMGTTQQDDKEDQNEEKVNKFMKQFEVSNQYLENQQKQIEEQKQLERLLQIKNDDNIPAGSFITCTIKIKQLPITSVDIPLILARWNNNKKIYNTFKLRHHRWYPLPLKSGNPGFIIAGWHRFQAPITYGTEIENKETLMTQDQQTQLALRYLKYTPHAMHCYATCYGPQLNPGTHMIVINKFNEKGWRIAANGVVFSSNPTSNVYKKLKLIGTVSDMWKNTVYSQDLFTTTLEGRAFIGCGVETISKIRGIIKGVQGTKQGIDDQQKKDTQKQQQQQKCTVRITFEDKIRKNDLIILKTQVKYKIDQISIDYLNYSKNKQQYMRMAYEIRQQDNKPLLVKNDTRFLSEQEEQQYEHVTFADRELTLKNKDIKALPFDEQVKYLQKQEQLKQERESTNALSKPKKLKNKVLNDLLQSDTNKQERLIAEMKALDNYVKDKKDKRQEQEKYAQEKWEKGMNKRKDEQKKENLKEKQKRKRYLLEKVAEKERKKHQI